MTIPLNLTSRFLTKMRFLRKQIFDTNLYKVSVACTKIRMQSLPKWQKYNWQTLSRQFVLKHFFVLPEHCQPDQPSQKPCVFYMFCYCYEK